MAANAASLCLPRMLTDRRNDITTVRVLPRSTGLTTRDVMIPKPGVAVLVVESGSVVRHMQYSVPNIPGPAWLIPTIERSGYLLLLPFNWDLDASPPIEPATIQQALNVLFMFMGERSAAPQWTPTREGGVQLDWHANGIDLEIEISVETPGGNAVFKDNGCEGADWDGAIGANLEKLRRIFNERLIQ